MQTPQLSETKEITAAGRFDRFVNSVNKYHSAGNSYLSTPGPGYGFRLNSGANIDVEGDGDAQIIRVTGKSGRTITIQGRVVTVANQQFAIVEMNVEFLSGSAQQIDASKRNELIEAVFTKLDEWSAEMETAVGASAEAAIGKGQKTVQQSIDEVTGM